MPVTRQLDGTTVGVHVLVRSGSQTTTSSADPQGLRERVANPARRRVLELRTRSPRSRGQARAERPRTAQVAERSARRSATRRRCGRGTRASARRTRRRCCRRPTAPRRHAARKRRQYRRALGVAGQSLRATRPMKAAARTTRAQTAKASWRNPARSVLAGNEQQAPPRNWDRSSAACPRSSCRSRIASGSASTWRT